VKYGMNLLLWTGELNEESIPVLESLKEMGFDGVEVPIFNTDLDYAAWAQRLDDLGRGLTTLDWNEQPSRFATRKITRLAAIRQCELPAWKPLAGCWSAVP